MQWLSASKYFCFSQWEQALRISGKCVDVYHGRKIFVERAINTPGEWLQLAGHPNPADIPSSSRFLAAGSEDGETSPCIYLKYK